MSEFDRMLPSIFATFFLPEQHGPASKARVVDSPRLLPLFELYRQLPFPGIRISKTARFGNEAMRIEIILNRESDGQIAFYHKVVLPTGLVLTDAAAEEFASPQRRNVEYQIPGSGRGYWSQVLEFADPISSPRQIRYIEQQVSRQVKRALGVDPQYREYVVIKREETRYKEALTLSQMYRRSPLLHAVRGHLRVLANGRGIPVRPHARGKGSLFQVKDYLIPEAAVSA